LREAIADLVGSDQVSGEYQSLASAVFDLPKFFYEIGSLPDWEETAEYLREHVWRAEIDLHFS
jgi:hypothetical protein